MCLVLCDDAVLCLNDSPLLQQPQLIFLDAQKAEPMVIMFMVSSVITALLFIQMILSPLLQLLPERQSKSNSK